MRKNSLTLFIHFFISSRMSNLAVIKMLVMVSAIMTFSAYAGALLDTRPTAIRVNGDIALYLDTNDKCNESGAYEYEYIDDKRIVKSNGKINLTRSGNYLIYYTNIDATGKKSCISRNVYIPNPEPFVTRWYMGNGEPKQLFIDTFGKGYNFSIDWGDGTIEHNLTHSVKHTYRTAKKGFTVSISGDFPRFKLNSRNKDHLSSVEN